MIGLVTKVKIDFLNKSSVSVKNQKYINAICSCCFSCTNKNNISESVPLKTL